MCIIIGDVHQFIGHCLVSIEPRAVSPKIFKMEGWTFRQSELPSIFTTEYLVITIEKHYKNKKDNQQKETNQSDERRKIILVQWILKVIPVCLWNRLISGGFGPFLSHTGKSCIASYYRYFSTNIKIKNIKSRDLLFYFNICLQLTIIRCDK